MGESTIHKLACLGLASIVLWAIQTGESQAAPRSRPVVVQAPEVIHVGPHRQIRNIAEAASVAKDGDIIEVDAGEYVGDVAVWNQSNLTIRGVGGVVHLVAGGASAEGKGIWVTRGNGIRVENFEFTGARVSDRNGAGIRHEGGTLKVVHCTFKNNENGILSSDNPKAELDIEESEFGENGAGDGYTHNLYAGKIARLSVTGSYFHHAKTGHLLKSRAHQNFITFNRLTDEIGGHASYELEFPNGGVAYVIGNVIQQGTQTDNPTIISFGTEGYAWPVNEMFLVNNTIVDDRAGGGKFLQVKPGVNRVKAINNLLIGRGELQSGLPGEYAANYNAEWSDVALAVREDYRPKKSAKFVGKAVEPGEANGVKLRPLKEYVHPMRTRLVEGRLYSPGALQDLVP